MKTLKIEISGRVQGVNFRYGVKNYCDKNEINGYVTNREDGSVLIVAQGAEKKMRELISWIEGSPGFCKVEKVEKKEVGAKEEFGDFRIRYHKDFLSDQVASFRNFGKNVLKR
jgi:acylphosphatase